MVERAEDYGYSSARYYGFGEQDELVTENLYYAGMGKTPEERRTNYLSFLRMEDPYRAMVDESLVKV